MTYREVLAFQAFGHQSLFGHLESRLDRIEHERTLPLQAGWDYQAQAEAEFSHPAYSHAAEYRRQLYADMGLKFI